ncbi:MAG: VTT domain-containing protein [Anaerolineae bacterium]|nr:VTT domain-containing protein [Anaerolineae bacterium]
MDEPVPQSTPAAAPTQVQGHKATVWTVVVPRVLVLVGITALTLAILLNREQLRRFAGYGYPGIFLISLLGSATVIVPAPSIAVVFAMGAVLNPFLMGPVAGLGEALGETTGYLAGATGRAVIRDRPLYQRVVRWTRRYGLIPIFVLSAVPNPFFDIVGIAAGALQIPFWRFLIVCFLGKTVKAVLMALLGAGFFTIL